MANEKMAELRAPTGAKSVVMFVMKTGINVRAFSRLEASSLKTIIRASRQNDNDYWYEIDGLLDFGNGKQGIETNCVTWSEVVCYLVTEIPTPSLIEIPSLVPPKDVIQ